MNTASPSRSNTSTDFKHQSTPAISGAGAAASGASVSAAGNPNNNLSVTMDTLPASVIQIGNPSKLKFTPAPINNGIIKVLFARIDTLLPYKSGFSVAQVLADPNYNQSRSHLLKLSTTRVHFDDLLACIYNLLIQILHTDQKPGQTLYDRPLNILESIYIVIYLLSSFLDSLKSQDGISQPVGAIFEEAGMRVTSNFVNQYHLTMKPSFSLPDELCSKLLSLLLSLKNDSTCMNTLYEITDPMNRSASGMNPLLKNASPHNTNVLSRSTSSTSSTSSVATDSAPVSVSSSSSSTASNRLYPIDSSASEIDHSSVAFEDHLEVKKLLEEKSKLPTSKVVAMIDGSVSSVLQYIAATNSSQYLVFQRLVFKHFNVESLYIRGSHLLMYSFITAANFNLYAHFLRDVMYYTKRPSQRSLILQFYSDAIMNWALYRTKDFLKAMRVPLCCKNAEILFDSLYKQMRIKYCPRIFYSILSCMLLLQPKVLSKFITDKQNKSTTQALKRSISSVTKLQSSKQKFMTDFTQLVDKSPEYAQPLLSFLIAGCAVSAHDINHPLYQFVLFMKDPLLKQLKIDTLDLSGSGSSTIQMGSHGANNYTSSLINHLTSFPSTTGSPKTVEVGSILSSHKNSSPSKNDNSNCCNSQFCNQSPLSRITEELKVGAFSINVIVNQNVMSETLQLLLSPNKNSVDVLPLITGSFRRLIVIPSLSTKVFHLLQELTPIMIKLVTIFCDRLDCSKDNLIDTDINSTSFYSESDSLLMSPISVPSPSSISRRGRSNIGSEVNRISSTTSKASSTQKGVKQSVYMTPSKSPVQTADDSLSTYSSVSVTSGETEYALPYFKPDGAHMDNHEYFKFAALKKQLVKADICLVKENMINLLSVYSLYPFLWYPEADVENTGNPDFLSFEIIFRSLMDKIASLLYSEDDEILDAVESLLLGFCVTVGNTQPIKAFIAYIGTSIMIDSVSAVGISTTISNDKRDRLIRLVFNMLEKRADNSDLKMMYENKHLIESVHGSGQCRRIIRNFEKIVFMGLFSSNIETIRLSKRILQFYVFVVTNPHHHPGCFDTSNLEIANAILKDNMTFGIVSVRKKLRDHLCHLKNPTETLICVWRLLYGKISTAYKYKEIPSSSSSADQFEKFFEQHHIIPDIEIYSEYVASLGGIIMSESFQNDSRQPYLQKLLETFIKNKFMSLFSQDVRKREHTREILSVSIHPDLCTLLMREVKQMLDMFAKSLKQGQFNVCELFLSVLKGICQVDTRALFPVATDLVHINTTLMRMFNIENNAPDFLRLKLKFCRLQVQCLGMLDDLSLNGNILTKNVYARLAADFLEGSFEYDGEAKSKNRVLTFNAPSTAFNNPKKMSNKIREVQESEMKDLLMDIRVEASVMLKMIFYKLPLDTPRHNYGGSEDDQSAASVVFSNYFNLFVRLLEKLNNIKNDRDSFNAQVHRSASIIKEVIQALVNLLIANSKIGLKYSLPLGYHSDELIRVSFIDVFSTIIKKLYMHYEKSVSKVTLFKQADVLFTSDIELFLAAANCCPKSNIEAYASALTKIKLTEKVRLRLFLSLIKFDVMHTSEKNEILRSNTIGTRVTALYSNDNATEYLVSIFRPIFSEMIDNQDFFEVEKITDQSIEERQKNLSIFIKYLNQIADALYSSVDRMPIGIRLFSKTIFDTTSKVLQSAKFTSINAYLFLRLINPTIVSPERSNIIDCTNLQFKRSLIQLARVIQMIVNESAIKMPLLEANSEQLEYSRLKFFGFMERVVDFDMDKAFDSLRDDFDADTYYFMGGADSTEMETARLSAARNSTRFLHGFFYTNWLEIREKYFKNNYGYGVTKERKVEVIEQMDNILANIGLPRRVTGYEIPESVKEDKSPRGILLYDFLSRASMAVGDNRFIKVLITKDGLPLICVNTLEFPEGMTTESYVYTLLQTMTKFWETPYCMLADLTACCNYSIFEQGRPLLHSLIPSQYKGNCKRAYYVNMSTSFFLRFKATEINYSNEDTVVEPEYVFITTNDDAKTMSRNKLIGYFNPVSHDGRVTFHDVSIYQEESNRFIPVRMKIGNQFMQLYSAMPQRIKIINKMHIVNLVDIFRISELDEMSPTSFTGVANEISMIDTSSGKRIILTSTKKVEIMRTLYFSKARLNSNPYANEDSFNSSGPNYTVGQLLNISFSGLLSKSDEIRKASYSLLASIQQSVNLKTDRPINSIEGVVFPYGATDYVCATSASIAANHPNLTYCFIYGFFNAFEKVNEEEKNSMVLCVSPWVKNIYHYVYLSDSVLGPQRARVIIRKFVRASREQKNFQVFSIFVWPQLSLEDGLIEIIIDEIAAAAIDHEAEGNDWYRITKYWPLRSSVEICSVIIRRLKEKSYSMKIGEGDIEAHTRWIETTVLARFLSYLIFDSLLFIERYIGDIFYIVTIYMDYGPYELRDCLLNLTTRAFHSYLSSPRLTHAQKEKIRNQIELLNGARYRMLFGLTRVDDQGFTLGKIIGSEISHKVNAISTICRLLISFIDENMENEAGLLQVVKWNNSVSKIAYDDTMQIQSRAVLILGALSTQGISRTLLIRAVDLMLESGKRYSHSTPEDIPQNLEFVVCTLNGFGQSLSGLDKNSRFHPLVFWCHISLIVTQNINLLKFVVENLKRIFTSIVDHTKSKNIRMLDYLFESKEMLKEPVLFCEIDFRFRFRKDNFDVIVALICCKGLESPFSYNESVETIKEVLKIRYEEKLRFPDDEDNDYMCYLFFLYLISTSNKELFEALNYCGFKNVEYITCNNNVMIPRDLLKWFDHPTMNTYYICMGAADHYMTQKLDELASTRITILFVELYSRNKQFVLDLFSKVDGILEKLISTSTASSLLKVVLDFVVDMMTSYDLDNYQISPEFAEQLKGDKYNDTKHFNTSISRAKEDDSVLPMEEKTRIAMMLRIMMHDICDIVKETEM